MTDHRVDINKLVKDPALHPAAAQSPAEQPRDAVWAFSEVDALRASQSRTVRLRGSSRDGEPRCVLV